MQGKPDMSLQAVRDFLNRVVEDEQLLKDLTLALEAEDDRAAVAHLASKRGFHFSPEELWTEVQNLQAEYVRQADAAVAALSDEELEGVGGRSGGGDAAVVIGSKAWWGDDYGC
ncbi:Nif11-like leader peptide family natural product precursor [Synechococcus sp. Nb3U1]|uniref:Nif11-like leader peptide family natural product precursor n=1 Tax=Synechococcus sp. Nb3U1 TaxID=1914529 RepID=UPI001F4288BE|nr:Nif11-like leader peptide family natural product precursor [Synechococcus sp. Nb3U1]MCF2971023.1 Nif11-like leader peptide family natural product precursor [Synechococcus sp. Nb3U1]